MGEGILRLSCRVATDPFESSSKWRHSFGNPQQSSYVVTKINQYAKPLLWVQCPDSIPIHFWILGRHTFNFKA